MEKVGVRSLLGMLWAQYTHPRHAPNWAYLKNRDTVQESCWNVLYDRLGIRHDGAEQAAGPNPGGHGVRVLSL
jgi:hypothetical protein